MARRTQVVTLAELVRRATEICDPNAEVAAVDEFALQYEDADEPINSAEDLEERIQFGADEEPALTMAQAVVLYLAHRRDEIEADDDDIIRLAARSEWNGSPPQAVADWIEERGIEV